ncbi:DUF6160 family protein [Alkanindiges illinoisensis]|uniref:DUF6160 family protein n=1 Tax=Alkanindiges illinoisensis TaxID=197183 RepID=UPI000479B01A|nr:DUF6160 family protein [Alkanindiges illinoisensis]
MTFKNVTSRKFALSTLASSLMIMQLPAYALQEMNEQDMRKIDGQDGIYIGTEYDRIDVDKVYWEDKTGTAGNTEETLRGYANGISITPAVAGQKIGTEIKINTGSNGTTAGIDLDVNSTLGTVAADSFQICNGSGGNCGPSIGSMAIQSSTPVQFHLNSQNGLFSEAGQAELTLGLRNINIYLGQKQSASVTNQLIMRNFNFNFYGKGNMFVSDSGGLRLQTGSTGYVDFTRVNDPQYTGGTFGGTNSGLNLEFMHKSNVTAGTYNTDNAKGIIRAGASGRMKNAYLVVRGTDARDVANPALGFASNNATSPTSGTNASIIGSTGIAIRMKGEFTRDAADAGGGSPTTLELGGAGKNAYGVEFGKLTPLLTRTAVNGGLNTGRAYFDSGDVYINLANTKTLNMPANDVLNTSKIGNSDYLTKTTDYTQQIHGDATNPYSVVIGVRGLEFQALARQARFIASNDITGAANIPTTTVGQWGIGLPIYNLNANIATYGTTYTGLLPDGTSVTNSERLGFAAALSTQGVNKEVGSTGLDANGAIAGSKTTSIFLIDGGPNANDGNNPTDYYFGLRNIDMYLKGYGSIGVENGKLNVKLPNLLMAMSAEIAAGYLPGAKSKTVGTNYYSPINNFLQKTDVLFGLKIKLNGDMNFALVPSEAGSLSGPQDGANRLGFVGSYLVDSGAIQIVEPVDGSILGLDNLSGRIGFDNAIVVNKDNVGFNFGLNFNPNKLATEVFRVKDINMYPSGGNAQRLGEMVITGGRLNANMTIVPRN